jgi:hypothetical protein
MKNLYNLLPPQDLYNGLANLELAPLIYDDDNKKQKVSQISHDVVGPLSRSR